MRKYLFSCMTIMMVAIVSVGFMSCSKDDDDEVVSPNQFDTKTSIPDPDGTVLIYMSAASKENYHYILSSFHIDEDYNFEGNNIKIASVGMVKGLSEIKSIPTSGWASRVAVVSGYGYVVKYSGYSGTTYARLFVVSSTGSGYAVKYQSPFNP